MKDVNLDLLCYNFNKELVDLINKYGQQLPVSIVFLMVKETLKQIETQKDNVLFNLISNEKGKIQKTVEVPVETEEKEKED